MGLLGNSKNDAWRKHPLLTQLWRDPFPGMRTGAILFAGFCFVEWGWAKMTKEQRVIKTPKIQQFKTNSIDAMPTNTKQH